MQGQNTSGFSSYSHQFSKEEWLCSNLKVLFKIRKIQIYFQRFLKEYQISQCRFEFNNQIVDENNLLKDICKDEQSIVLIYEFQYNLKLVNKEMQNEIIKVSFYPSEIIGSVFKRYLSEKFSYLYNGQLVDIQKQFEVLRIQNNSKVYYFQFHNFTLEILKTNTKLQIQIDSLNYKIIDAISPKMKEHTQDKFTALYNNRELDLQKTFLQEKVMSGATIQCQLPTYLQVIIHDNEFDKSFNVHPNICIGQILAMMMDSNPNKKMLSYKDQKQLENDIIVSKLQNNNGIIELIYKELISTPDTIYQPSGSTQDLKTTESSQINIVIININNDDKIFETVKLDQKIGDFLKEFEIKNEFSSINIFYEGAVVDYDKTFEEIGANPGSLFEII